MPEQQLRTCVYHILRYTPNLVRDEWVNIGVLIYDPAGARFRARLIEEPAEFARVKRLHPAADEALLNALPGDLEAQLAEHRRDFGAFLARLDQTLSNALQLSPQKGVLTEDLDAELDRLYHDQVEPPRYARAEVELVESRNAIRTRANQVFRSAGVWARLERRVRVDEFTYPGDPLRLDYAYRRNGTRGFVHALALGRDPGQAKILAYTADSIRTKLPQSEFIAVTEVEPRPAENPRHRFVAGLLEEKQIPLVPLGRLAEWANRLRPKLLGNGGGAAN